MTGQARQMKQALKALGVTKGGKVPSVRTPRNKWGEYIEIVVHTDKLTDKQIAKLQGAGYAAQNYIPDQPDISFGIVREWGWRWKRR